MPNTIAITGASGMIGRHLCDHFRSLGWNVRAMMRDPSTYPFRERGIERARVDLAHGPYPDECTQGADVVIHAAYTTRFTDVGNARRVNEMGTERVLDAARDANVRRFVFVSSLAARKDALSYYGRSKFALEQLLDPTRDLIVRPGLVLARDGGLAHRLAGIIATTRVVPLVDGGDQIVQTVHVDDLCVAFERAVERGITGAVNVAEPDGMPMREFLRLLAESRGVRAMALPLPVTPMLLALRTAERLGIPLPFTSENLLGIFAIRHVPTRADLDRLGITVRTARESVAAL
jgi:nucleoside-diphosphate-sugar epimerase